MFCKHISPVVALANLHTCVFVGLGGLHSLGWARMMFSDKQHKAWLCESFAVAGLDLTDMAGAVVEQQQQ